VEAAGAGRIVSQDAHSIANGLIATLLDTDELSAMGRRARVLAERFRWEHITDTLVDVYEEGLARWRRARSSRVAAIPDVTAPSAAVIRSTSASAEK
jgi:DUF1365 family protein